MIALLSKIVQFFVCWIETALVIVLNAVIVAVAFTTDGVASILPDMPDPPALPTGVTTALGWLNWFFPVSTVVEIFTFMLTAWALWQAVAMMLRWMKAHQS